MNKHINAWIDAYLDDELTSQQQELVESHLSECQHCQNLVEQRHILSALLKEAPTANERMTPEQFVAETNQQIRTSQSTSPNSKMRSWVWSFIPVALLLVWVFYQTVSILSSILSFIPGLEQVLQPEIPPTFSLAGFNWDLLIDLALDRLGLYGVLITLDWNWFVSLLTIACIGLLYLGWLAGWWVHTRQVSPAETNIY
jgi:hypothetical protein